MNAGVNAGVMRRLPALLAILGLLLSCTAKSRESAPPRLVASATQFRYDEGTHNLHAGVTNAGTTPVTVTSATLAWSGFDWPTVQIPAQPVPPGQTAAFVIAYGAARCDTHPGAPYLLATVDGQRRRLPLQVDDPGLLDRLRQGACARQRLSRAVALTLHLRRHTVVRAGEELLPGEVVLRRRAGAGRAVSVVDLGGSVLFDLTAAGGRGALPARLAPPDRALRLPVLVGSAGRCDPHARGNSSQTFLFSVYTRLGTEPALRTIFVPSKPAQQRLLAVLDRACRAG
jgi:hypothetical protein